MLCLVFNSWSPGIKWSPGAIVKWDGDTFKAEGDIQNVALPGNSSHEGFYVSKLNTNTVLVVNKAAFVTMKF